MNRVYKVIYNRARNLYQVVSEIVHSRGKTKSLTAQHQHERLTTAILIALFAMGTSLPVGGGGRCQSRCLQYRCELTTCRWDYHCHR